MCPLVALICAALLIAGAPAAWGGVNVWTTHGPYNVYVRALAINPTTPSTLYAGTETSGVYKSTNSGASWTSVNTGLTDPSGNVLGVGLLAIDPTTPSTLYAGSYSYGVFQSTDSGASWSAGGLTGASVSALAIDPSTPSTLYAGTAGGVFQSTNSGASWTVRNADPPANLIIRLLAIDPITPSTLYAEAGYWVYRSTDSGASWTALGGTSPDLPVVTCGGQNGCTALTIDPQNPSTLYVGTYDGSCGELACFYSSVVYRSTNSGSSWTASSLPDRASVTVLAVDPTTRSRLYAGTALGVFDIELTPPACVGDCNDDGQVAIDDLLTLVNIDLGSAQASVCPSGLTSWATVDVALIIQAVNRAMDGCGPSPWEAGPFGVGVRQVTFTKKSATHPTEDRPLVTDIWYPTAPNTGPEDVDLGGVVNAPWATGATQLPLLLFSHGGCSLPTLSRFFMRAVTSYGFIVAAPLHAGDLMTDPSCGVDNSDGYANRPSDIKFVIDSLLQLNTDPSSFFSGAIDPHRIGMSGLSNGGNTTVLVSESDSRVIAGLVLAGAPAGLLARIHIPMMVQGGALDSVCPFDSCGSVLYQLLKFPKYLVEMLHTGHTAFADDGCYPNCCGPSSSDCTACFQARPIPFCDAAGPDALTADAAHQFILRYTVPFLLHWVAGDNRFDTYLAPDAAPPGVIFTVDTGGTATRAPVP